MTTEPVPVSVSVGLAGLAPVNWISIVGYLCERFDHTRMPPGRTPDSSGVSFGSATIVLGAVAGIAGLLGYPYDASLSGEKLVDGMDPARCPARELP
jgi:hypothetical protein